MPADPRSPEEDIALLYGFMEELIRDETADVAARFLAADFVAHDGPAARPRGEFVAHRAARHARFRDAVWTIELLASVGGLVICHTTLTCPEPPGGPPDPAPGPWEMVVARVVAGRIAECWCACDERLRADDARPPEA
jgi:hypothetical protein